MKTLTMQEAFDTIYAGVVAQGKPAVTKGGLCAFRADGLKCAVGMVLEDSDYMPRFETLSTEFLYLSGIIPNLYGVDDAAGAQFYIDLQVVHDDCQQSAHDDEEFLRDFKKYAAQKAHYYGLNVPSVGVTS